VMVYLRVRDADSVPLSISPTLDVDAVEEVLAVVFAEVASSADVLRVELRDVLPDEVLPTGMNRSLLPSRKILTRSIWSDVSAMTEGRFKISRGLLDHSLVRRCEVVALSRTLSVKELHIESRALTRDNISLSLAHRFQRKRF
jgi:hypothetical protein